MVKFISNIFQWIKGIFTSSKPEIETPSLLESVHEPVNKHKMPGFSYLLEQKVSGSKSTIKLLKNASRKFEKDYKDQVFKLASEHLPSYGAESIKRYYSSYKRPAILYLPTKHETYHTGERVDHGYQLSIYSGTTPTPHILRHPASENEGSIVYSTQEGNNE